MRLFAGGLFAVLAVACRNSDVPDWPVNPGAGGPGGGGIVSSGGDGGTDATGTVYRVCLLTGDVRGLNNCAQAGADNITVTIGSGSNAPTAQTGADGTFSIQVPSATDLDWYVTDTGNTPIIPTIMPLSGGSIIPVLSHDNYQTMSVENGGTELPDGSTAGVFVRIDSGGNPVQGATVVQGSLTPTPMYGTFYDNNASSAMWHTDPVMGTGAAGTIWFSGLTGSAITCMVKAQPDSDAVNIVAPIMADWITVLFVEAT